MLTGYQMVTYNQKRHQMVSNDVHYGGASE